MLMINANVNLKQLDSMNKIIFWINREHESEEELARIMKEIGNLPNVGSSRFISKEDALDSLQDDYELFSGILNEDEDLSANVRRDNPIEHSVEIEYKDINEINTLIYQLENIEGYSKISNRADIAEFIKNIQNIVMAVLIGFSVVLFFVAAFIILNTVKLSVHSRKQEIMIMRYIGATNFFIVFPFLLEGVIIGIISAVIAYIAQYYIYGGAISWLSGFAGNGFVLDFIEFSQVNILVFLAFLFAGSLCGFFGSGMSSRKYLKV